MANHNKLRHLLPVLLKEIEWEAKTFDNKTERDYVLVIAMSKGEAVAERVKIDDLEKAKYQKPEFMGGDRLVLRFRRGVSTLRNHLIVYNGQSIVHRNAIAEAFDGEDVLESISRDTNVTVQLHRESLVPPD